MWMNPDLKLYATKVAIDSNDMALRSGMSCQAEIIVKQYTEAIYVPLQSVIRVGQKPTVYVKNGNNFEPMTVNVGLDNNKVIHILEGLKDGDVVQLNPPLKAGAVYTKTENELGDGMQEKITDGLKNVETNANANTYTAPAITAKENAEAKMRERMLKKFQNMTPEQIEEMKKKYEKMTPEEREKEKEKMRKMFGNEN
jgi:hypothetical protein